MIFPSKLARCQYNIFECAGRRRFARWWRTDDGFYVKIVMNAKKGWGVLTLAVLPELSRSGLRSSRVKMADSV